MKKLQYLKAVNNKKIWKYKNVIERWNKGVCTGFLTKVKNERNDHALHEITDLQMTIQHVYLHSKKPFMMGLTSAFLSTEHIK